ncbi:hypothetical protein ACEN2J_17595, partial [Pseudorhodobacter sp. W20_MBD10_FR17]|uniref:hypothetical protein n=1 Tax=Pseudorhodobacter sp. W20_MBD10_FR17 TaxID=3240266 RepID=UPI003F9898E4
LSRNNKSTRYAANLQTAQTPDSVIALALELVCEFSSGHIVALASKITNQGVYKSRGARKSKGAGLDYVVTPQRANGVNLPDPAQPNVLDRPQSIKASIHKGLFNFWTSRMLHFERMAALGTLHLRIRTHREGPLRAALD